MSARVDETYTAPNTPRPICVFDGDLAVSYYHGPQRYPVEVWEVSNGSRYAIVTGTMANTSPMNGAEQIVAQVRSTWDKVEAIVEYWAHGPLAGGHWYAISAEDIGHTEIDVDHYQRLGLLLKV